ncbi:phospholipase D-like protein [Kocuria sp. AG109]|uniref:PLD nuclease N-terminal domain-containing protein n=1 Tax=Rothia kristinae TaxID=37923 RepID=UPI00105E8291|nr:PLD nuclease N-terminal domain-containing protein [Rothia kristinae]MED6046699.1 PLD nuclease N-terminal domain-containing protein [Rothia kristinae]TDP54912.1 phospholipase D-like protein [Kocuria sp. AG109]WGH09793.1 PLD nuclease N-terminal domain-containing protein [Rothia kristinae]
MRAVLIIAVGALLAGLSIYALLDVARTERSRIRALPKPAWFLIALLFPVIGPVLWLSLGTRRDRPAGGEPRRRRGPSAGPAPQAGRAPDDDAAYLDFLAKQAERRRKDREREQRRKPD